MSEVNWSGVFALSTDAVKRAISILVNRRSHEHLPGYLAIWKASRENRSKTDPAERVVKSPDIGEFYDQYLRVPDADDGAPYLRPFKSRGRGIAMHNRNVAGSYAPSSLRNAGAFPAVVTVSGENMDGSYALTEGHAQRALDKLLKGNRVPAASLAVFLLRDYGFEMAVADFKLVLETFRDEFHLKDSDEEERAVYDTLFEDDSAQYSAADLIPWKAVAQ